MALYKVQSPYNAALQGMQGAAGTAASMTKKQEVEEPKKSFGGALGSMVSGGAYGLGMADMFTGGEATRGLWKGIKGAFNGAEVATGQAAVDAALSEFATIPAGAAVSGAGTGVTGGAAAVGGMATPVATAAGSTAVPAGVASLNLGGMGTIAGSEAALASAGAALETGVGAGTGAATGAEVGSAGGPWGAAIGAGIGAFVGLASYYL